MLRILFLYKKSTLFAFGIENLSGILVLGEFERPCASANMKFIDRGQVLRSQPFQVLACLFKRVRMMPPRSCRL